MDLKKLNIIKLIYCKQKFNFLIKKNIINLVIKNL